MTDIIQAVPIQVGQRWISRGRQTVRILATDADGDKPIVGQVEEGQARGLIILWHASGRYDNRDELGIGDLIQLAPQTIKREVALYRYGGLREIFDTDDSRVLDTGDDWQRMTEPLTIEFTLLPGETA
jgi:hypothetical protein